MCQLRKSFFVLAANLLMIVLLSQVCARATSDGEATLHHMATSHHKKIIEYGWDVPTAEFIQQNIAQMETSPFDGIIFMIDESGSHAFDTRPWTEDDMQLNTLAQIEWDEFTDNFLILFSANHYGMDWFNDTHWQTIAANMRLYARAARTAGCVGIVLDPEPYGSNPWEYSAQLYPDKSFAVVEAQVRQRGAQWLSAIQDEFPNPRILSFYLLSVVRFQTEDDPANIPDIGYALLRAFLEGMLDVASPATRIIEGNEYAYYYDETNKYFDDYEWLRNLPAGFISSEIQGKFASQVEIGMALYMDNVLSKPFLGTVTFPDEYKQIWWEHNVYYALATTDEYVWCYSEEMNWWENDVFAGGEEGITSAKEKYFQGMALDLDLYKTPEDYWDYDIPGTITTSPAVSITGPFCGAILNTPITITIQAVATGSSIEAIEFYMNSQKYGESSSNPADHTWTDLPSGEYVFLARVFDVNGNHGTSGPLRVTVTATSTICLPIILSDSILERTEKPGYPVDYDLTLCNLGTCGGQADVIATSSQGWEINITPSQQYTLPAGNCENVTVSPIVPPDAHRGAVDVTLVTARLECGSPCDETVTETRKVTTTVAPILLSKVNIAGPTKGNVNTPYTFTATFSPPTATLPITLVWQAVEQREVLTTSNALSHSVTFSWATSGPHTITATATNGCEPVSTTHSFSLEWYRAYLPQVLHVDIWRTRDYLR
jgi:hypothetical protein